MIRKAFVMSVTPGFADNSPVSLPLSEVFHLD